MPVEPENQNAAPDEQSAQSRRAARDAATASKEKAKRRGPRIVLWTFVALIVAVAAVAGTYVWRLTNAYGQADTLASDDLFPEREDRPDPVQPADPKDGDEEAINILLLGSDTRAQISEDEALEDISGQRSDTIMVVNIPADRESVNVMSIMRDNWVPIPGHGHNKINAALAFGGPRLLIQTIEDILDVPIDHVALIDFEGFKGLTDALGGVTVNNSTAFTAGGRSFAEGEITLNGEDALTFVRERYAFADGDYQRVRNQQAYMAGLLNQVLSRDTLTSPGKILDSVDAISPFLTVDDGLSSTYLVSLGLSMRDLRSADVTMFTSPTNGTGMVGAASVVHPDWRGLEELSTLFKEDRVADWSD